MQCISVVMKFEYKFVLVPQVPEKCQKRPTLTQPSKDRTHLLPSHQPGFKFWYPVYACLWFQPHIQLQVGFAISRIFHFPGNGKREKLQNPGNFPGNSREIPSIFCSREFSRENPWFPGNSRPGKSRERTLLVTPHIGVIELWSTPHSIAHKGSRTS